MKQERYREEEKMVIEIYLFSWMKEEENQERESILHIYAFFIDKDKTLVA
jgi:hypothetical protein